VQEHLMKLAHANANGSGKSSSGRAALAYAEHDAGKASELMETLESEVQDSANATV